MNRQQIDLLRRHPTLADAEVIETHISWVLLTTEKVYKLKKDVQFSFLDFSTLALRKYYCEHELLLNQRLAPDLYEEVVAVNPTSSGLEFGPYQPNSLDYAIRMRRVAKEFEMTRMLDRGTVQPAHLERLAARLAAFHREAKRDASLFNPIKALDEFSDIGNYADILIPHIGAAGMEKIQAGITAARHFLRRRHQRLHDRRTAGHTVDGHGDLHAANVFLENGQPLIFDCLEFNDAFRMVDVLDEVAFLYVDLEAANRRDLAEVFAAAYQAANPTLATEEDQEIFNYYKCYRANVRLKVTAIKLDNLPSEAFADKLLAQLHRYHELYQLYGNAVEKCEGPKPLLSHP